MKRFQKVSSSFPVSTVPGDTYDFSLMLFSVSEFAGFKNIYVCM